MENVDTDFIQAQVHRFLNETQDARVLSERDRDYKDHKQWSSSEVAALLKRKQAPIVVNRIRPKIEGLVGLYMLRHTDPKAYPRTQKHEGSSHAVTDALRYVADNNDFEQIKAAVADEFFVEGYGGAMIQGKQKRNEMEIEVSHIPWDRIYYDPHSRMKYFEDARFKGVILWMGEDQVLEMFPSANVDNLYSDSYEMDETFEDRPRWHDSKSKRIRVALHFFIHKGVWHYCAISGETFLIDPAVSPFKDDDGEPECPLEIVSANIDRNNARYGEVRGFISQQDEINHRRSKALHLLSQRQTASRKGAIKNIASVKRELAKPDGHIEYTGEKGDFEILNTGDMAQGQFDLYQDAKNELDAVSFNAQLAGERQGGDLSGRAIDKLQAAGTIELNRLYMTLQGWEKRVYRQIWSRIKQYWKEEKWIRITDNQDNLKWVGLNHQTTTKEWLEESINDEAKPQDERQALDATYQFLTKIAAGADPQLVRAAQQGNMQAAQMVNVARQAQQAAQQKLEEIIEVKNGTSELDVDIIIDQSFDTINAQQEQFNQIIEFARSSKDIDIIELINLSTLRGKDELIEKIEKRREQVAQTTGNLAQMQAQTEQARLRELNAKAGKLEQETIEQQIENQVLLNGKASVEVAKAESEAQRNRAEAEQKNLENLLLTHDPSRITSVSV